MQRPLFLFVLLAICVSGTLSAQRGDFDNLLGGDLSQWDSVGDGVWKLTPDGILLGRRPVDTASAEVIEGSSFEAWRSSQAWLYTKLGTSSCAMTRLTEIVIIRIINPMDSDASDSHPSVIRNTT